MPVMDDKKYGRLLAKHLPRAIESDAEQDHWTRTILTLRREASPEANALAALIGQLVADYERNSIAGKLQRLPPVEILQFLIDENGLKQIDLVDVFGTAAVVSEVLSGRRRISQNHARRLSERFRLPVDIFV